MIKISVPFILPLGYLVAANKLVEGTTNIGDKKKANETDSSGQKRKLLQEECKAGRRRRSYNES